MQAIGRLCYKDTDGEAGSTAIQQAEQEHNHQLGVGGCVWVCRSADLRVCMFYNDSVRVLQG